MLLKEYRICMPLTVDEYKIGQLYMISKHSHEQSDRGEGVEVVQNEPFEDPHHGNGQFTEKRVYLNSKLPSWARAVVPKIFYVTEKAWNYYPYTITEYTVGTHAALYALQAPLRPCVCCLLHLFWTDRLRRHRGTQSDRDFAC